MNTSASKGPNNRALVVARDGHIRTAGARWLQQAGFEIGALDELAKTVLFLISDGAGYINGDAIRVTGGLDWAP